MKIPPPPIELLVVLLGMAAMGYFVVLVQHLAVR